MEDEEEEDEEDDEEEPLEVEDGGELFDEEEAPVAFLPTLLLRLEDDEEDPSLVTGTEGFRKYTRVPRTVPYFVVTVRGESDDDSGE